MIKSIGNLVQKSWVSSAVSLSSMEYPAIANSTRAYFTAILGPEEKPHEMSDAKLACQNGQRKFCTEWMGWNGKWRKGQIESMFPMGGPSLIARAIMDMRLRQWMSDAGWQTMCGVGWNAREKHSEKAELMWRAINGISKTQDRSPAWECWWEKADRGKSLETTTRSDERIISESGSKVKDAAKGTRCLEIPGPIRPFTINIMSLSSDFQRWLVASRGIRQFGGIAWHLAQFPPWSHNMAQRRHSPSLSH
jgi:hypothetical protein